MFNFFKKRKEKATMSTLDEVRKAYEDLNEDDKKAFHQTIADRIHESIGEQEEKDGDKDSQSAADREHEALGAEHADGEGEVTELHDTDGDGDVDKVEHKNDENDVNAQILGALRDIKDILAGRGGDDLEAKRKKYGMGEGYAGEARRGEYTDADVDRLLRSR